MTENSAGTYDDLRQTVTPHLIIKIVAITGIADIIDTEKLTPYFWIEIGNNRLLSDFGTENHEKFVWEQTLQVDLDSDSPLYLTLQDKDEYSYDAVLHRFMFDFKMFQTWKESTKIFLKISQVSEDESEVTKVNTEVLLTDKASGAVLEIEITYMDVEKLSKLQAEITNHRNIVRNRQAFTQYEVWISRADGLKWRVDLRFSEFCSIRSELEKVLGGISMIPFPKKTYFDWLGRLCSCASRFNENLIGERKKTLQNFLNVVLDNANEFSCDGVTSLLKLTSPL